MAAGILEKQLAYARLHVVGGDGGFVAVAVAIHIGFIAFLSLLLLSLFLLWSLTFVKLLKLIIS